MTIADYSDSLRISGYMGRIAAICLGLAVVYILVMVITRKGKKKY
jgi:hypothetical protein